MAHLDRWLVGACMTVLGIAGLFIAARTEETFVYGGGLAIFVATVLFNFLQIKQACGRKD